MDYNPENATKVLQLVEDCLRKNEPPQDRLKKLWWTLLFSRARALTNGVRLVVGQNVAGGPFKGMVMTQEALALYQSPMLLGCYEHELHPVFEKIIARNYTRILNIGCSVGYYAIGLARRMPQATIDAFDISAEAQTKCRSMAEANGVADRIRISGQFYGEDFAAYADQKTLVLMDIEGGEKELLDPARYPALQKMDIVVELHDLMEPGLSKLVCDRFVSSHAIELVKNRNLLPDVSALMPPDKFLDPFDQLLLGWEGRDGLTPWGVFMAKSTQWDKSHNM